MAGDGNARRQRKEKERQIRPRVIPPGRSAVTFSLCAPIVIICTPSMRRRFRHAVVLSLVLAMLCAAGCTANTQEKNAAASQDSQSSRPSGRAISVAPGGRAFVDAARKPFVPWGFNYDRDSNSRLLEDYWETDWPTVESDFREMKRLGANVVRVHLQFARFMDGPDRANRSALFQLDRLLNLAEREHLYLDLTGLACYRKADVPGWYDQLDEKNRWRAQAAFWEAVASRCAASSAVFCYDLMNEPLVPTTPLQSGQWLHPFVLGGFNYVQYIALDPGGRIRTQLARLWVHQLASAIRKHDSQHLITVGLLPNSVGESDQSSGFDPATLAPEIDFVSVHLYPAKDKIGESIGNLAGFNVGKPVLIEEIFPLNCSTEELGQFIEQSRPYAAGWLGFYWGRTPEQLRKSAFPADVLMLSWLDLFQKLRPTMTGIQ
jgi:hypothetical protein